MNVRRQSCITKLEVRPNRFGRLGIIAHLIPINNGNHWIRHVQLSSDDWLRERHNVGDSVVVCIVGHYARIEKLVHKAHTTFNELVFPPENCSSCRNQIHRCYDSYYCLNVHCPGVAQARLCYAVQPHVLDIPIDETALKILMCQSENINNVATLLYASHDKQYYSTVPDVTPRYADLDVLEHIYEADELEEIAHVLRLRTEQLFGHQVEHPHIQGVVQRHTLEALSIPGLMHEHINLLHKDMCYDSSLWSYLPDILSDPKELMKYDLSRREACVIAKHTQHRTSEFDLLAREF